jgi:hypothetical protein
VFKTADITEASTFLTSLGYRELIFRQFMQVHEKIFERIPSGPCIPTQLEWIFDFLTPLLLLLCFVFFLLCSQTGRNFASRVEHIKVAKTKIWLSGFA